MKKKHSDKNSARSTALSPFAQELAEGLDEAINFVRGKGDARVSDLETQQDAEDEQDIKSAERAVREWERSGKPARELDEVAKDLGLTIPRNQSSRHAK